MNYPLSPEEVRRLVARSVDRNLDDGMCFTCAVRVAGKRYSIARDKIEDVYFDAKTKQED